MNSTETIHRPSTELRGRQGAAAEPPAAADASPGLRRAGAAAAFTSAAAYVVGFVLAGAYLVPNGFGEGTPAEQLDFIADHQAVLVAWYSVIYLLAGSVLVVLALALHQRLRSAASGISQTAAAFGLVWAGLVLASGMVFVVGQDAAVALLDTDPDQAATAWVAIDAIQSGLGGGIELVGGLWVLLLSWAAVVARAFPRGLVVLGGVVGVAGVLTVVPAFTSVAAVFGLGFIAWFVWTGLLLRRGA